MLTAVIIDAASFGWEIPSYIIPMERSRSKGTLLLWDSPDWAFATQPSLDKHLAAEDVQGDGLLIVSPTVLGYSFRDRK